jgi:hypothetical protein
MVDEELRAALDSIEHQWNAAEEYVKRVERLRRGLVVGASINELRYAGRRLIEAYACAKLFQSQPEQRARAFDLLREVTHFCLRAQHDAMDAAVTYIDQALEKFEREFGPDLLHDKFIHYLEMKQILQNVSDVMARSRNDREARNELYAQIKDDAVPTLIEHHLKLETSRVVFEAAYKRKVKNEQRDTFRFWLSMLFIVGTFIAAVLAIPMIAEKFKQSGVEPAVSDANGVTPDKTAPQL